MKSLRPSPATFVATLALFAALGGTAVAARVTPQTTTPTFKLIKLQNGWTGAPFGTERPAVTKISGIVHFKGAIATPGTNPVAFTLPSTFRPSKVVYVVAGMCNAAVGRLQINPTGVVDVQAAKGAFSDATCFTSLDGISFAP
jgi:hypothetical protein